MRGEIEGRTDATKARQRGSIRRRGNAWQVSIYVSTDASGKRQYLYESAKSRREAQKLLTKKLGDRDKGALPSPTRETLDAYLDRWLEAKRTALSRRTHHDYTYLLATHVRPKIGARRLIELGPRDVQTVYDAMLARGLSGRTVHVTHSVVSQALGQAVRWRILGLNPAEAVVLPRWERREMLALSAEQVRGFLAQAEGDPLALYFHLAFATGMRPSELLGLRWDDVNLDAAQVSVRWALERVKGKWSWKEPKAQSRRTIPLPGPLVERMRRHKAAQAARILERRRKGFIYLHHGLVFAGRFGEPIEDRNLARRHLKEILKEANLPAKFRLYDTRHTCATLLAAAGENPKVIAERLGHRDATITLNVYTHVAPQMQERATATLGDALYGVQAS